MPFKCSSFALFGDTKIPPQIPSHFQHLFKAAPPAAGRALLFSFRIDVNLPKTRPSGSSFAPNDGDPATKAHTRLIIAAILNGQWEAAAKLKTTLSDT
jgi:hypothetical protein